MKKFFFAFYCTVCIYIYIYIGSVFFLYFKQVNMGIHNFKIFLNTLNYQTDNMITSYDSIFIDIQSYLYKAIQESFKTEEHELQRDICYKVVHSVKHLLYTLFSSHQFTNNLRVLIAFDGDSIPMKQPTQKLRRSKINVQGKMLYKIVLFGHNTISDRVYQYLIRILTNHFTNFFSQSIKLPQSVEFILCGSATKGEGEHKLFYLGKYFKCKKPIIVSIDNDIFIIALSQLTSFDSIQIYKSNQFILNINFWISRALFYDKEYCIQASLLFGNDFIPPVINLTKSNCPAIHEALKECQQKELNHVFYTILSQLVTKGKLRYKIPPCIEAKVIQEFWKNCFWVQDYYKKYNFPQKYMNNYLFDIFDKNHIVTALLDMDYSRKSFKQAEMDYQHLETSQPLIESKFNVFNPTQLKMYNRFFPKTKTPESCHIIRFQKN